MAGTGNKVQYLGVLKNVRHVRETRVLLLSSLLND